VTEWNEAGLFALLAGGRRGESAGAKILRKSARVSACRGY